MASLILPSEWEQVRKRVFTTTLWPLLWHYTVQITARCKAGILVPRLQHPVPLAGLRVNNWATRRPHCWQKGVTVPRNKSPKVWFHFLTAVGNSANLCPSVTQWVREARLWLTNQPPHVRRLGNKGKLQRLLMVCMWDVGGTSGNCHYRKWPGLHSTLCLLNHASVCMHIGHMGSPPTTATCGKTL